MYSVMAVSWATLIDHQTTKSVADTREREPQKGHDDDDDRFMERFNLGTFLVVEECVLLLDS